MERDSNRKRELPPPPTDPARNTAKEKMSERRRRNGFLSIREEINLQASFFRQPESRQDNFGRMFRVRLENMLRRVVREEFEKRIHFFSNLPPRPPPSQNSQPRYKLIITTNIKSPIYTDDTIEPIKIIIYDTHYKSIVSHSENSLSSSKLKIVILNAEFWKNEKESWSRDEFNKSILVQREGRGPILTGEIQFRLENGEKIIKNLVMKDNSSWTKSGFMIGVMIENEREGFRVLEGLSNPLRVMERRGKVCQKPDELQLTHTVKNLRKIGKNRVLILENYNIKTVYDFLFYYHNNQAGLREILGIKSESDKDWRAMVDHAKECNPEYYNALNCINISPMSSMAEQMNITYQDQIQFANPNNNNFDNSLNSFQFGWIPTNYNSAQLDLEASGNNNMPLVTSNGPHFVGSSSSEPNSFDDKLIQDSSLFDASNELGKIFGVQISLCPSNGELNNQMECIFTSHESANPHQFRNNSFDPFECEKLVQNFISSLSNNVNGKRASWLPVHRKRAIITLITSPARKRARPEPPVGEQNYIKCV